MPATMSTSDRLFTAGIRAVPNRMALSALRKATHLLSLAVAQHLVEARHPGDPLRAVQAKLDEKGLLLAMTELVLDIVAARWDKVPDRQRPHYTPGQRFQILRIKHLLVLSLEDCAKLFRISVSTVARWEAEMTVKPETKAIGTTVRPSPPVRRYADVVHHLVQAMDGLCFGGCRKAAAILARAGWKVAPETVRRYRRETPISPVPSKTLQAGKDTEPEATVSAAFV